MATLRTKQSRKRIFDAVFSAFALTLLCPVFLVIMLLIKASSSGPIFYGSARVGIHGKNITCWKFRTMVSNADEMLQVLLQDPLYQKQWTEHRKFKKDLRITKIGHFLRKTSLDELPQFWNVLKGDLSLVGPRPISREESAIFLSHEGGKVFSVRPGVTGLWQTSGRSDLSYEARIALEKEYVAKQSFALDLWLILKTIPAMLFPKGAY